MISVSRICIMPELVQRETWTCHFEFHSAIDAGILQQTHIGLWFSICELPNLSVNVILGFYRDPCNAEGFWVFQRWTVLLLITTFRGPWSASSSGSTRRWGWRWASKHRHQLQYRSPLKNPETFSSKFECSSAIGFYSPRLLQLHKGIVDVL